MYEYPLILVFNDVYIHFLYLATFTVQYALSVKSPSYFGYRAYLHSTRFSKHKIPLMIKENISRYTLPILTTYLEAVIQEK